MRKIQRRDFLKAMGLATAALGLTACGGSGAASASSVSSAPASSSSAPSASAQPESAVDKAAPAGAPVTQFQTGELTIGEYTFKAQYIPFDVRRELDGAHHCIHADSYRGNYFFSFYNEDDEEQSAKIFEYAIKDDRMTPVAEYNIDGSNALSIDRNGILYAMDPFDVYCYDLNSSDPEEPGDALDYMGSCYSSKDRDLTVIYWTDSAPVLVQDGEYTELTLEGDNEIGPFCSMPSLNLSGDELLTVGEPDSSGDYYFAAFDLDGNELARSSQPVGSFDAVMMKRPNGYLLDTGYMWELYAPDGTFLEKSLPVGERETLCQLCGDFCTFDVFLPLEENAFFGSGPPRQSHRAGRTGGVPHHYGFLSRPLRREDQRKNSGAGEEPSAPFGTTGGNAMAGMLEYKCPCCDGAIQFDSATQKMKCPYCDTEFDVDTLKGYDEELKDEKPSEMEWITPGGSWAEGETAGLHTYSCKSCGGEIVGDDTMAASACPFCGNPIVLTGQFAGALRPDLIIPFKLDKKAAKAKLQEHLKGKTLLPRVFRSQNHIDEIKGVYVPFWLFDSDADAQLRFTATRTRCWSDSKYDYTETNYYSVRRDGTLGFDAVPVDGSSKIEDDLMESIEPFAMQDAIPFQTAYLAGYVADKYDVSAEDSIERANKRIRRSTEETFQQTVTGYDSVKVDNSSIQLHGGKAKYALFPVWLLSTSWRGENYLFAMNGQTGKFVGDLPVDKGAARKWMLGLTAALSAASYGVMWLLWLARIL